MLLLFSTQSEILFGGSNDLSIPLAVPEKYEEEEEGVCIPECSSVRRVEEFGEEFSLRWSEKQRLRSVREKRIVATEKELSAF